MGLVISLCKKMRFETRSRAAWTIRMMVENGTDTDPDFPLRPYYCFSCEAWHVGHDKSAGEETD